MEKVNVDITEDLNMKSKQIENLKQKMISLENLVAETDKQIREVLVKVGNFDTNKSRNNEAVEDPHENLSQVHVIMADYLQHFDTLEKRFNFRLDSLEKYLQPSQSKMGLTKQKKRHHQSPT